MKKKRPLLSDVAKEAGCSIAVASRALSANVAQRRTVSAGMQSQVVSAAERLGYLASRTQSRRRPFSLLGVFIPQYTPSLVLQLISSVAEEANRLQAPVRLFTHLTAENYRSFADEVIENHHTAGVITYLPLDEASMRELRRLDGQASRRCCPVVYLHDEPPEEAVASVQIDNYRGGWLAGEHLKGFSCQEYWVFGSTRLYRRHRITGFIDAVSIGGATTNVHCHFIANTDFSPGNELLNPLKDLWERRPVLTPEHPLGIFLDTDYLAPPLYNFLARRQVTLGREVKVVGYDGTNFSSLLTPKLTTVAQPFAEMGRAAVRKLLSLAEGNPEDAELLSPSLVQGEST